MPKPIDKTLLAALRSRKLSKLADPTTAADTVADPIAADPAAATATVAGPIAADPAAADPAAATATVKVQLDRLGASLLDVVKTELVQLVQGAQADVDRFAIAIARDMARAQLAGKTEITAELLAQIRVLAEVNRLRFRAAAWSAAIKTLNVVMKTGASILTALV